MAKQTNGERWQMIFSCYRTLIDKKESTNKDATMLRKRAKDLRVKYRNEGGRCFFSWVDVDGMDK
jgi:hypothetical protein|tara:strand:+ start:22073 stop:22267 length:195 start_codon:yes stop_codon:yes gene_type:complete